MAHPSSDDPDFPGTTINPPYARSEPMLPQHGCRTVDCHGVTLEVFCADCLGDGVDLDSSPDVE